MLLCSAFLPDSIHSILTSYCGVVEHRCFSWSGRGDHKQITSAGICTLFGVIWAGRAPQFYNLEQVLGCRHECQIVLEIYSAIWMKYQCRSSEFHRLDREWCHNSLKWWDFLGRNLKKRVFFFFQFRLLLLFYQGSRGAFIRVVTPIVQGNDREYACPHTEHLLIELSVNLSAKAFL